TLLPVDSEHNAIFQCLPAHRGHGNRLDGVRRLLLTASGGPFRGRTRESLRDVTPDQACAHPHWVMGRQISVDSATLMNKGLEVIEAHHLFGIDAGRIEVVVHPQSVIHSLVDYVDGSVLAQLGNPDMRTALAHALAWPERIESGVAPLDLAQLARFDFEAPDLEAFPCLALAYAALREGGTAPAILNAANEVAVAAFLAGQLPFLAIAELIERTLSALPAEPGDDLAVLLASDHRARRMAEHHLARMRSQ
ncbi:MAG: 1-deoxy-D-xylulose-5-phosphate reductoisomerase, partial [Arenimonas sp.]